ncbi:hypothetical protein MTR_3g022755 [Medicago truncatula]|uniref:Uncharacterized protein n=1 Tax=Medicago truncatula TaxID=3880 RepID=A0A072UTC2_MEDTR|nr:hypothetical protein MTR_3g022755 [Medicago truncatula]
MIINISWFVINQQLQRFDDDNVNMTTQLRENTPPLIIRQRKSTPPLINNNGRILDGVSLGAKERDLEQIGHENTKIGKQNISPTSQKPGTARASLGTAVPPSRDLLLLLLGLQAILFWRTIYRGIF